MDKNSVRTNEGNRDSAEIIEYRINDEENYPNSRCRSVFGYVGDFINSILDLFMNRSSPISSDQYQHENGIVAKRKRMPFEQYTTRKQPKLVIVDEEEEAVDLSSPDQNLNNNTHWVKSNESKPDTIIDVTPKAQDCLNRDQAKSILEWVAKTEGFYPAQKFLDPSPGKGDANTQIDEDSKIPVKEKAKVWWPPAEQVVGVTPKKAARKKKSVGFCSPPVSKFYHPAATTNGDPVTAISVVPKYPANEENPVKIDPIEVEQLEIGWSKLPPHLLRRIFGMVTVCDAHFCRYVCKDWYSVAKTFNEEIDTLHWRQLSHRPSIDEEVRFRARLCVTCLHAAFKYMPNLRSLDLRVDPVIVWISVSNEREFAYLIHAVMRNHGSVRRIQASDRRDVIKICKVIQECCRPIPIRIQYEFREAANHQPVVQDLQPAAHYQHGIHDYKKDF